MNTNPYQDPSYPYPYPPFGSDSFQNRVTLVPNMIGMDYLERHNTAATAQQASLQANSNIDSLLHVHRRKLQRRAANRKSAQLSRARKKAHLEELKGENLRLQQLVDVLDSQPELVFCVTSRGNITYISERTVNFLNVTNTDSENDDDPTHITQILSSESADSVLKTIQEIEKISPARSALAESSMIFSSKNVEFKDAFGNPLEGTLRCARVIRRPVIDDALEEDTTEALASSQLPPAKKAKSSKAAQAEAVAANVAVAPLTVNVPSSNLSAFQPGVSNSRQLEEWSLANLSSLRMLTECVSNMADDTDKKRQRGSEQLLAEEEAKQEAPFYKQNSTDTISSASKTAMGASSSTSGSLHGDTGAAENELENEFVCVIRTSDSCFARYSTRSDLYMFVSTPLSTASMEAHDMRAGNSIARHPTLTLAGDSNQRAANGQGERQGGSGKRRKSRSPPSQSGSRSGGSNNGSNAGSNTGSNTGSNGSLGDSTSLLPKSESSVDKRDNTSMETGSDDSHNGESNSV